jgi:hypothetical protein
MGSGSKTTHAAYAVAPSQAVVGDPVPASELAALTAAGDAYSEALAQLNEVQDFAGLAEATAAALEAHSTLVDEGWPPQLASEALKGLKGQTSGFLGNLSIEELQGLAAAQGFEHPGLVGWNTTPGSQHPLVHWLDPLYPPESPSKLAIQAKASERFAQLAAGETLNGLTLADVQALEAGLPGHNPPGTWLATPAEVVGALTSFNEALAATGGPVHQVTGEQLAELVKAENHLAAASCPAMAPEALQAAKAAAKANVDQRLSGANLVARTDAGATLVAEASAKGLVDAGAAKYLSPGDQLALVRSSTNPTERDALASTASQRAAQVASLKALHEAFGTKGLAALDATATTPAELGAWAKGTGDYFSAATAAKQWMYASAAAEEVTPLVGYPDAKAAQLTTEFRAWAKAKSLDELRATAKGLGMDPQGASRAQLQNWVAASWDPTLSKAEIQAAAAKAAPAPAGKPAPAPTVPKSVTATSAPLSSGPAVSAPRPPAGSFTAKQQGIVAALKAHQGLTADLPPRPSPAEVEAWSFGPGTSAALGGAHAKTLHAAPDGSMWLFKPDSTGGARAEAEATASAVYHRVGIPSVGVYARSIGGKAGCVQPIVSGASNLAANPKSWLQADVDAMVRIHVAAWGVGDHDANHTNVLRTPSGALLPVDGGQAFKFFGSDRLDVDYHPNGSYGAAPPVFHQAYKAAKAGGLAPGVRIRPEAALPAIKAFEAIPDSQYRAMLAGVATKGVAGGAAWVPTMRKAAQKHLGTKTVSDAQVAAEFVDHAVARKNGLRQAFAGFFAALGFDGATKLEKVA